MSRRDLLVRWFPTESPAGRYGWRPVIVMSALFFSIGFVTWLNGPLITFVQVAFSLSDVAAFLVPACFYLSYLVFPLPATLLSRRTGLRKGLIIALCIMAAGTALFGECITVRSYAGALTGLGVLGAGLTLLQITINPYVSLLGAPDRAAQRIAIMGVSNKFAGILAPVLFAFLVMPDVGNVASGLKNTPPGPEREALISAFTGAVHGPYMIMALLLLVLALFVSRARLPELDIGSTEVSLNVTSSGWLLSGVFAMFLYVGVEVLAGDAIGSFGHALGLPLDTAKYLTAVTLAAMMAGYIAGMIAVPRFIAGEHCFLVSCTAGIILCILTLLLPGTLPVLCVALLGFANAMIMPTLFPFVLQAAGEKGSRITALLVMAFSGGAVLPQIYIHVTQFCGARLAFSALAVPAYLFMAGWMIAFRKMRAA
ncbi:glucose/galactose MFS transporter [Acetobacter sp. AN02]|uniref:glucose/galactose MFS transporter n=1 Tax=Acetobacter sp. AN02 TaxID=2894186 RepID=UPI0024342431|nr:glucose/galactose MFS transporter [Acetobacter sp. AN02]MDG6094559.1 glucose/galactose MFS transporter [Acetobacter sp. AN02]